MLRGYGKAQYGAGDSSSIEIDGIITCNVSITAEGDIDGLSEGASLATVASGGDIPPRGGVFISITMMEMKSTMKQSIPATIKRQGNIPGSEGARAIPRNAGACGSRRDVPGTSPSHTTSLISQEIFRYARKARPSAMRCGHHEKRPLSGEGDTGWSVRMPFAYTWYGMA